MADRFADLVLLEDIYSAEKIIEATLAGEESLFYIFIVGMNGEVFAHSFGTQHPGDLVRWNPTGEITEAVQLLATEAGIIRDVGVKIFEGLPAEVHVGLQDTRIEDTLMRIRNRIVLGSAAAIFIAWLLSSLFSHLLNRPLSRLVDHTEQLAQGNFGGRVDFPVSGEVKELAATIDTLSQELALFQQRSEDSFQQMLRAEKLSALGRLSAGLAHELRNYWFETVWNPYTNPAYKKYAKEFPFQVIVGRIHHAMTGTQMVPWLGENTAEGLWHPMNNEFEADVPDGMPVGKEPFQTVKKKFKANSFSVGTIWMNDDDATKMDIKMGDLVVLENPLGKSTQGKVFVSGGLRPGVIKMAFGSGGRFSPGLGVAYKSRKYTPDHNMLCDPEALSPIMGQPAYADMIVKVKKA